MPILQIHTFPDPILRQVAKPVTHFDEALATLAGSMLETMYTSDGIGLAANQVAVLKRIVVVDVEHGREENAERKPQVFVNPEILEKSGESVSEEGCLSVVDFRAEVQRASRVVLRYQDLKGTPHQIEAEGLFAVCLQHELDHLDGVLFIDHLPLIKQKMVKKRLTKLAKSA